MTGKYIVILSVVLLMNCCTGREGSNNETYRPDRDDLAEMNSYILRKDRERIQSYFERKGIPMQETATGLWYNITVEGSGKHFRDNDLIRYEYKCSLLDGTMCYNSSVHGPAEIRLGRSELPSGLNEGFKLLRPASEAIFILPPHLAYGLIGDGKKIPPRSTVVYTIQIIK